MWFLVCLFVVGLLVLLWRGGYLRKLGEVSDSPSQHSEHVTQTGSSESEQNKRKGLRLGLGLEQFQQRLTKFFNRKKSASRSESSESEPDNKALSRSYSEFKRDNEDLLMPSLEYLVEYEFHSKLVTSIAISEDFKKLSVSIADVIPPLLVKHISSPSHSADARVKELHSFMSDVVRIVDMENFLAFFDTHFEKIRMAIDSLPPHLSEKSIKVTEYVRKPLRNHLQYATHLDKNDLVITWKKGVLKELVKVGQKLHTQLDIEDEFVSFLKKQLCSYEWVHNLMSKQKEIASYLTAGKKKPLSQSEKSGLAQLIAVDSLTDKDAESALKLLEHYGIVQLKRRGPSNHVIVTVTGVNLSFNDIIENSPWKAMDYTRVKEIQFLCTDCFYIDASMCYKDCQLKLKNVAIVASRVIVKQDLFGGREIDLSGLDGISYTSCASDGFGNGAHGGNGRDGEPGESGGNILICADQIENSELLVLRSKGGDGGKGEGGGNGRDGRATPSKSDNLSKFGDGGKFNLIKFFVVNPRNIKTFEDHCFKSTKRAGDKSAYGKTSDGVDILYGRNTGGTYAFLYSRGVDGVSADGGNAGRGGRGGGGGKGGRIEILRRNGMDRNYSHSILARSEDGSSGPAGKPGTHGKKDLAESRTDYLVVDGWLKKVLRYNGFIDARPYSNNSNRLERGWYFCKPEIARCLESLKSVKEGHIEFFNVSRDTYCPTRYNSQAEDGEQQEQRNFKEVIHSSHSKPVNKAELQMEYQVLSSEYLEMQDNSSMIQFLEDMQQSLREMLEKLDTTYVKQQHKQVRRFGESSEFDPGYFFDVDAKAISRLVVSDSQSTDLAYFPEDILEIITKLKPSLSFDRALSMKEKYHELRTFIDDQLEELSLTTKKERRKIGLIYQLIEIIIQPDFQIYVDHNNSIQNILDIFNMAENITVSMEQSLINDFRDTRTDAHFYNQLRKKMAEMKQVIQPRYKWLKLQQAHQELLRIVGYSDKEFQRKAVAVALKISIQTSITNIDKEFDSLFQDADSHGHTVLKIQPFTKCLPTFNKTLCSADLPLSLQTKSALEMLMVFLNEANEKSCGKFHFPSVLAAVEREYKAYHCTISDADLMFIMTYFQEKLDQSLLNKTQLEDLFCKKLLSEEDELTSYKGGFIFHQEKSYQITDVEYQSTEHVVHIKTKSNSFEINFQKLKVTLNTESVEFPEALLLSKLDIQTIWKKIKVFFSQSELSIEKFLNIFTFPQEEHKFQLAKLLEQARSARDVQFDVFAFYPPSQWIEKLILSAVERQYGKDQSAFVSQVEETLNGLSHCRDKSLYWIMYTQFLQQPSQNHGNFKLDLLETLRRMRSIFIEQNLCSLVTKEGIALANKVEDAKHIFDELVGLDIIDFIGTFLPNTTEEIIELFCKSCDLDATFLKTIFTIQKSIDQLADRELSFWNHKLEELQLKLSLQRLTSGDNDVCDILLVYIYQMQRNYGEFEVKNFFELACHQSEMDVPCVKLIELFSKCSSKEWNLSIVISLMKKNRKHEQKICLSQDINDISKFDWKLYKSQERSAEEITKFIKSHCPPSEGTDHLSRVLETIMDDVNEIKRKEKEKSQFHFDVRSVHDELLRRKLNSLNICKYSKTHITHWIAKFKEVISSDPGNRSYMIEAFAVIRRGITLFYATEMKTEGVVPRDTQMIASLLFFNKLSTQKGEDSTKLLQQISTGEGKTMILCMVAIYKVLLGEKVDIVTSSSVLATRDAADQKRLYDLFNITVSHCCHEEITIRRKAYEADVIYGDIGSFQRDILETEFYDRDIRTARRFDNVFVDEVDSMLVDKGQNMLYLPHALPDMNYLEQIYLEIWSLVNAKDFFGLEHEQKQLYDVLGHKLLGSITPNAFTPISGISEKHSEEIFESLVETGIIDSNDHCFAETSFSEIKDYVEKFVSDTHTRNEVLMIIQQHLEAKPLISELPKALHPFVKKSLRSWIGSAVCAKYFRPNKEYIVDIDRRESASDRYPKIVIMDNETGVEQESSEWGNGLHQFLQLKHNLRLSTESLKAVYMSNISFFTNHYKNLLGVTGTLGSVQEHALFKKIYQDVLIVKLPTNWPSKIIIEESVCCSTKNDWEESLYSDIRDKLQNNRVVLLICEDIESARSMHHFLLNKDNFLNSLLYFSSHQEKLENKSMFEPGQLIIATNLAGRGTDIKLAREVKENGGLHVCLSYLPPNARVEMQAYGRAARSGDPGSCKMIFHAKEGDLSYAVRKRNLSEAHRVTEIEEDYYKNIKLQESLFDMFQMLYKEIRANHNRPEHRAILDYCLDCWAFFLDHYTDAIESIPQKEDYVGEQRQITTAFKVEVEEKISKLKDSEIDGSQLFLTSSRLIQLGHAFMKQELRKGDKFKEAGNKTNFNKAVSLYRQAAKKSDNPFAHYYLAAAQLNESFKYKLNSGKEERVALKQALYEIIPRFKDRIRECQGHVLMLQLANRHHDQAMTGNVQYFQEQKQHEIELYSMFTISMQEIIGKEITPTTFKHIDWGEEGAKVIFDIVFKEFQLKGSRIAKNYVRRLDNLLSSHDIYYTYEAKIRKRVESLKKKAVTKDDFIGVIPDKEEFWDLLLKNNIITAIEVPDEGSVESSVEGTGLKKGLWNPEIDIDAVQLESWDCLDHHSFDWIQGLTEEDIKVIYSKLQEKHILNSNGQLVDLDLAKPLEIALPESCVEHYKAIKDTLWNHTVYRFVLNHLRDCAEIDIENDIPDYRAIEKIASQKSVVDILISLNQNVNVLSEEKTTHMVESSLRRTSVNNVGSINFEEHVPNQALNDTFLEQLEYNNLIATLVSGHGLNCFINAIIQHAKRDYFTSEFQEASDIRECVRKEHPDLDLSGMLHCDDEIAREILTCVNSMCSSTIGKVSAFIASSDGPILYGGTSDKRFPSGKHVALWQQGNHFVAVVHHQEFVNSCYETESDTVDYSKYIPTINRTQLKVLEELNVVAETEGNGRYQICKSITEIELTLAKTDSELLSTEDREHMIKFLRFKLEVDFKTLNNSPRVLASNQVHMLYDDLCLYAVIEEVKLKSAIDKKFGDKKFGEMKIDNTYWYKHVSPYMPTAKITFVPDINIPYYFDMQILNQYLERNGIQPLTPEQFKHMTIFLSTRSTMVSYTRDGDLDKAVSVISPEKTKFLTESQRTEVSNFIKLMLKARRNSCFITATLKSQQSCLMELDTPEITLRKLADLLEPDSIRDKGDVLGWFSDNQCDFVISLGELRRSLKSISTALIIIAIGVVQVIMAAVISVSTLAVVTDTLIGMGVSDILYGVEALIKGHCNFSQYLQKKKVSTLIAVATTGLGPIYRLSKGVMASKYAFKAAGRAVTQSISTVKITGKNLTMVMAKQVTTKIVKQATLASIDKAITLASDKIFEEMSQIIDSFSQYIVDSFDSLTKDQQLQQEVAAFVEQQDPINAAKYLHDVFVCVMQQTTFLEVWDTVEGLLQPAVNVAAQIAKKYVRGIDYAASLASFVTEPIKMGLVKEKMKVLKTELILELQRRRGIACTENTLDEEASKEMLNRELKEMKEHLAHEISERGRIMVTKGVHMLGAELKNGGIKVFENMMHKIKEQADLKKIKGYKREVSRAKSNKKSAVAQYEGKLKSLVSQSRNPKVFAHLVKNQCTPAFEIPALEQKIDRPIRLLGETGELLWDSGAENVAGPPLEIKFGQGDGDQFGHYSVGSKLFSVEEHGNDCLIHAVMEGAGQSDFSATDIRNEIARACTDPKSPYFALIRNGIAGSYMDTSLKGEAGWTTSRRNFKHYSYGATGKGRFGDASRSRQQSQRKRIKTCKKPVHREVHRTR